MSDQDDKKNPWGKRPTSNNGSRNNSGSEQGRGNSDNVEELFKKSQEQLKQIFNGNNKSGGGKGDSPFNLRIIGLLSFVALLLWIASGIFTVNAKEEGVVLRFGKYVRTVSPGLNYHLPAPIEKVIKLRVTDRYKEEIGYRSSSVSNRFQRGNKREILMLTGDENIVDVNFEVQWQISDARKFLFNIYDPRSTIRNTAESAMREVVGTTPINDILSEGRTEAQLRTKDLLQKVLNSYDAGVDIMEINMRAVPPSSAITIEDIVVDENGNTNTVQVTSTVDEAFKDVQAAKINKEETINKAIAYQNMVIPIARGNAQQMLQQAEGYRQKVIARAEGEAQRFLEIYNQYRNAPDVTRKRMYLETMENVFKDMDKIILGSNATQGTVPYLPLNELLKSK